MSGVQIGNRTFPVGTMLMVTDESLDGLVEVREPPPEVGWGFMWSGELWRSHGWITWYTCKRHLLLALLVAVVAAFMFAWSNR